MPELLSHPGAPPPPTVTLGRYTLLAQLAVGGMAEIFLARQQSVGGFEKILVVKKILDSYAADPGFVSMFLDEARIAAQLNHPNIVQIFDLGQAGSTYFIAMEYLAGESVSRLVRRSNERGGAVPIHITAQIVAQAAAGLHYAHTATDSGGRPLNVVHRDISPQNLVVTYTGVVKVVDFGIALAANRSSQTEQGKVKGKLSYMSPEQARGMELDARSDVFALGIVLFEALTGSRMFKQEDPVVIFGQILNPAPLPRASSRNPEVSFELDEIVARALRKNRDERYQSAQELHDALTDWLHQASFDPAETLPRLMADLFSAERDKRLKLLDQAARGDEISSGILTGAGTAPSMPTGAGDAGPAPKPPPRRALTIGLGAGAALAAVGLYVALRPAPVTPSVIVLAPKPAEVLPATLDVSAVPAQAHVIVDGADRGPSPVHVANIALGAHQVVVHLDGRPDLTRPVQIDRAGQSVELTLEMPPAPVVAPSPVPAPTAAVATAPERSSHPERHRSPAKEHTAPAPAPAATAAPTGGGTLDLDSTPWGEVTIDGKAMGETPLIGVALPAGPHSVKVANPDQNLSQTITVTIKPGETTAKKVKL